MSRIEDSGPELGEKQTIKANSIPEKRGMKTETGAKQSDINRGALKKIGVPGCMRKTPSMVTNGRHCHIQGDREKDAHEKEGMYRETPWSSAIGVG